MLIFVCHLHFVGNQFSVYYSCKGCSLLLLYSVFATPIYHCSILDDLTGVTQHLLTNYGDANKKSANVSGDNIFDDPILNKKVNFIKTYDAINIKIIVQYLNIVIT